MTLSRNGWIGRTAKLAVLLFAVQVALAAVSIGAVAAPVARDQFGNVLCQATDHARHPDPAEREGQGHRGKLDCCRLGCPAGAERFLPPVPVILARLPYGSAIRPAIPSEPPTQPSRRVGGKKARAPPEFA